MYSGICILLPHPLATLYPLLSVIRLLLFLFFSSRVGARVRGGKEGGGGWFGLVDNLKQHSDLDFALYFMSISSSKLSPFFGKNLFLLY